MTKFRQKATMGLALIVTSVVSIFAGGILLGAASADSDTPSTSTAPTAGVRILSGEGLFTAATGAGMPGEPGASCVIAFREVPEGANIEGRGIVTGAPTFTLGGKLEGVQGVAGVKVGEAVEARPLSPEEVEELKASGKLIELSSVAPADCTVIDVDELDEQTLPNGDVFKVWQYGPGHKSVEATKP